jgi:TnpA family transposase
VCRESAYVFDGLMHNDVVQSDIHSTDAFGYSEVIFATTQLLGFSYAPSFKNLKCQRLYIFKNRQKDDRSTWQIKPTGYCDTDRVFDYWDDILRFIATIKLKETTASDLFRRLNSYSKQHGLYQALKGFRQILKSFHPAYNRRAGAAYGHRKSAQWSRTYTPFHAGGVGRESA